MVFGFLVNAWSMWGMSGFSLQISPWDVFTWGVCRASAWASSSCR